MNAQVFRFTFQSSLRIYLLILICLFINTGLPLLSVSIAQDSQPSNSQNSQTWGLPEGAIYRLGKGVMGGSDRAIAFSPDGNRLAVTSGAGVWIYDVETTRELTLLTKDVASIRSVAYSPDGTILAAAADKSVKLWNVSTKQNIATLRQTHYVDSVAYSPDGETLISGSWNAVKRWNIPTRKNIMTVGYRGRPGAVTFSPDGNILAVANTDRFGGTDGTIMLLAAGTGQQLATLHGHTERIPAVVFSPDGATLATGSQDGTALLWEVSELIDD